jgi:hypothetical protein
MLAAFKAPLITIKGFAMNKIMLCMAVLLAGVSGCSQSDSELPPPQEKNKK